MLKTTQQRRTPSSTLIAFEPRQVTLARHQNMKKSDSSQILQNGSIDETLKSSKKGKSKKKSKSSSKTDVPAPLLRSIAAYLEHIGFSKTLAAFRAEASITDEDGDSKVIPLDLEMYYKYIEASKSDLKATINGTEELVLAGLDNALSAEKSITENDTEENKPEAPVESIKKKRKKSKESDAAVVEEHPIDNKKTTNDAKEDNGKSTNEVVSELQIKSCEKKKKSKRAADSLNEDAQEVDTEALGNQVDNSVSESQPDMSDKKPKKKKKTKLDSMLDEGNATAEVLPEETKDKTDGKKKKKKSKSTTTDETFEQGTKENTNAVGVEKKSSKKRKRLTSEEQESQPEDDILPKEARKSNTEVLDDNKGNDQQQKGNQLLEVEEHAGKKRKTENGQVVGQIKGDLEDNDLVQNRREGSAPQKSSKKQHGSAEPKTVNAFQRVKIEKVEFADDRLQDNSYWAKDGAEIGYGAKAQEVLGQVRGRDFRHEKTKKKRGSYRGGQIDMQSHSVKFKDSDDE